MKLNAITMFGKVFNWNSTVTQVVMVVLVICLAILILALLFRLIGLLRKSPAAEVQEETAVAVVEPPEPLQPVVVEVVQPSPQVIVVQQAPPEVVQIPAPQEKDLEDDEDDIIEEETFEGGTVRYNRSFTAKYIQAPDDMKERYIHLKNELLSYKKIHGRISWKRESFNFGRNPVARLIFRGKTLCLCLPLDPAQFAESKYHVEDVSEVTMYADTPCLYRIRNERRLKYAYELIDMVAQNLGMVKIDRPSEDYYLPYEGLVQLIDQGLVKRVIRRNVKEFINPNPPQEN